VNPNDPNDAKGFSLGFILASMVMIGVIGLGLIYLML
jgi:Tfp pilus assembly protein PilX